MRATLLAATFGAAQSMAVTTKSKKPAVQALLESATTMLKNGATPEVVTFAQYTLQEVTETVMPAIISESENDQRFITDLHSRFGVISTALQEGNTEIANLNDQETQDSISHRSCREQEYADCYGSCAPGQDKCGLDFTAATLRTDCNRDWNTLWGPHPSSEPDADCVPLPLDKTTCATATSYQEGKRPCEMALYDLWEAWVTAEGNLRKYHDEIHGLFCPTEGTANGTTKDFRGVASREMQEYMTKKVIVDHALEDYDNKAVCCEKAHGKLDGQSQVCNQKQTTLEETACQHNAKIVQVLTNYYRDYAQAQSAYQCAVEEVMQLETDRHKEWVTLEVVRCLLDKIEQRNGKPCEDSTGEAATMVAQCEEKHALLDKICKVEDSDITQEGMDEVSWTADDVKALCITYEKLPQHPDFCAGRHSTRGAICRPEPIPTCTEEWDHYKNLPGFPEPQFSSSNPGCNEYPACSACAQLSTPQPFELDSCPGYTVDGCGTDQVEGVANPVTFIRAVDGKADVRCCGTPDADAAGAKDNCQSQDFLPVGCTTNEDGEEECSHSPVDFTTPNEDTHTKCYFDVTYQTAMEVCHEVGLHICSMMEMQAGDCCGTGCWHNHHPIWVDRTGTGVAATSRASEALGDMASETTNAAAATGDKITYHTAAQSDAERMQRDGSLRDHEHQVEGNHQDYRCAEGMPAWPACKAFLVVTDGNCAEAQQDGDWQPINDFELCKNAAVALGFEQTEPEEGNQQERPEGCAIGSNGNLMLYTNTANAGRGASTIPGKSDVKVDQVCYNTQTQTATTTTTTPDWRDPANHVVENENQD